MREILSDALSLACLPEREVVSYGKNSSKTPRGVWLGFGTNFHDNLPGHVCGLKKLDPVLAILTFSPGEGVHTEIPRFLQFRGMFLCQIVPNTIPIAIATSHNPPPSPEKKFPCFSFPTPFSNPLIFQNRFHNPAPHHLFSSPHLRFPNPPPPPSPGAPRRTPRKHLLPGNLTIRHPRL